MKVLIFLLNLVLIFSCSTKKDTLLVQSFAVEHLGSSATMHGAFYHDYKEYGFDFKISKNKKFEDIINSDKLTTLDTFCYYELQNYSIRLMDRYKNDEVFVSWKKGFPIYVNSYYVEFDEEFYNYIICQIIDNYNEEKIKFKSKKWKKVVLKNKSNYLAFLNNLIEADSFINQ